MKITKHIQIIINRKSLINNQYFNSIKRLINVIIGIAIVLLLNSFFISYANADEFFTDFTEYSSGTQPSDWTTRWNTGNATSTVESSGLPSGAGSKALKVVQGGSNAIYALSWDDLGTVSGDIEILVKWQTTTVGSNEVGRSAVLHGSGSSGSEGAYFSSISGAYGYQARYLSGSLANLGNTGVSIAANTWYWTRFQRTGNIIRTKIWPDSGSEPGSWSASFTDLSHSSGWAGVGSFAASTTLWVDQFGVGTGGDAAPDAPLSGGGDNTGFPSSNSYTLTDFGFGAGGTASSSSLNYSLFGTLGEVDSGNMSSSLYQIGSGLEFTVNANVPPAPTFTNPANYYNRLNIILNHGGNPSDNEFAIQISTDNFVSDTRYIQDDHTIGNDLGVEDWQTYSDWGGGSGFDVIGLSANTTYSIRVAARRGQFFTQSAWGPEASAATDQITIVFDIDVSPTDNESGAPYNVDFGDLTSGSVTTATDRVWIDLTTNAENGGYVYVYSTNGGLNSSTTNYTISSTTGDLSSLNEGFGIQSNSVGETSGGPLVALSPYNSSSDNVGVTDSTIRNLYASSGNPVSQGRASFLLKAKTSSLTPSSSDYTETLTIIASGSF